MVKRAELDSDPDILITASTKEEHVSFWKICPAGCSLYNNLLKHKQLWSCTLVCVSAFEEAKQLPLNSTVLVHYDGTWPLKLACNASPYGVGAVISHIMDNGEERPIAFAYRTLTEN